jgi:hypothetical protein
MAFNILKIIAPILNWSPFLHISEDFNFGSVDNLIAVRLSFLAIPLGSNKIYLLSFVKDATNKWNFEIHKCLNFYAVCKKEDQSQIDHKTSSYKTLIESHTEEQIKFQIDFLKEKFNQNQSRKSTLYNKINNYTAITLVYLGFTGYLFSELLSLKIDNIYFYNCLWIMFSLSVIYTLNLFIFIKFALSIQAYIRSKFGDLKNDPTDKQLAASYYTDWYSSANEAQIISSIVCNIEEYFTRSLVVTVLLWLCMVGNNNWLNKISSATPSYENQYLIVNKSDEFLVDEFSSFLGKINKTNNKIYIISKKDNHNYKVIKDFIEFATKNSRKLETIEINGGILDNNAILLKYKD